MEGRQGKLEVRLRLEVAAAFLLAGALAGGLLTPTAAAQPAAARLDRDGVPLAPAVEGRATGTLTLNGVTVRLTHAYAEARPGTFDKNTEDTRVLLSDVALPDEAREDDFALIKLAREGRAHAIEIVIDHAGQAISGSFFAQAFKGNISASGMHRFTREQLDAGSVSGRLFMEQPSTFMEVAFQYDARFSAPIPRPLTAGDMAVALESPPARAATLHLAALRTGPLATFTSTLTAAAAADYAGPDGSARLGQLRADMPADAKVTAIIAARPPDDAILVTVQGHQKGVVIEYVLKLRRVNGVWKVDK